MEQTGYQNFLQSSQNYSSQVMEGKRAEPTKGVEHFGDLTSKKDLYEHQDCVLQVSWKFT